MTTLKQALHARENSQGAFQIGLVGAGQMGTGLMSQIEKMFGLKIVAVSDIMPTQAKDAYIEAGIEGEQVHWLEDDLSKANQLLNEGQRIATHSSDFLVNISSLDAIVECTGIPDVGAIICDQAITAGKPVINMNIETDATIGYYLSSLAFWLIAATVLRCFVQTHIAC